MLRPSSTESPALTAIDATRPSRPARIAFSIFMASRRTTVGSFTVSSPTLTATDITTPGRGATTEPATRQPRVWMQSFFPGGGAGCSQGLGSAPTTGAAFFAVEFDFVGHAVDFYLSEVVVDVADGNGVVVAVDFIFIFFHCFEIL